tara:strand:- start:8612 stop:10441 length:1830 start_codon:yes stop_codon:yes gene_type:complete
MALTTTDFNVSFLLGSVPKVFKFTDIADYTPQGVALTDVTGRIKVTAPSGVVYDNLSGSADITGSSVGTSRVNTTSINVPLLSGGTPEVGLYTFEYRATAGGVTVSKIKTFTYSYTKPKATNQLTADCLSPELKGSDTTNYLVNAVTPNDRFAISAASSSANTFSVSGEKVGFFTVGNKFDVISSTGNDGQYTITGVNYDKVNDKTVVSVASVSNNTGDGTIVQRRTTLYFTSVPGIAPLVGYSPILTTNSFYSQLQSFSFEAHVLYDFGGGFSVSDSFSSSDSINVNCDDNLCDVFCSINSVFEEYMKYKGVNKTLADLALERYTIITSHLASLRTAYECGDSSAITKLTEQIKEVAQTNDDCGCASGDPIPITGTGGATAVVASGGNGVNVATNVSGSTTTYTLTLAQSIINDISNATATSSVVGGTGISVSPNTTGTNTAYTVSLSNPVIIPKETLSFKFNLEAPVQTGGSVNRNITVSASDISIEGNSSPNFKSPTVSFDSIGSNSNTFKMSISDFQNVANNTYKVFVSVHYVESNVMGGTISTNDAIVNGFLYIKPSIFNQSSNSIKFGVYSTSSIFDGFISGNDLRKAGYGYTKIYFNVQIFE